MIVACTRCGTRFRLDESKIPAQGARVRCSQCKHAFVLPPPSSDAAIHAAAEEAAATGRPGVPDPTHDLGKPEGRPRAKPRPAAASRERRAEADDESDWEFNADPPAHGVVEANRPEGGAEAPASGSDPLGGLLDELGDPGSWNFVKDAAEAAPRSDPSPVETAGEAAGEASEAREAAPEALVPESDAARSPEYERRERSTALSVLGWSASVLLAAAIVYGAFRGALASSPPRTTLSNVVAGMTISQVKAHEVENATGAQLYVVSAVLRNTHGTSRPPGALLSVALLRADGSPTRTSPALVGPALPESQLREDDPARIGADLAAGAQRLATRSLGAGESIALEAVFPQLPADAARLIFRTRPVRPPPAPTPPAFGPPAPPGTPAAASGAPAAQGAAPGAPGATTIPSPGAARPSSE